MPKYIELEAAKRVLRQHQHRFTCADEANGYVSVKWSEEVIYAETAQNALDALPAVDAQPAVEAYWHDVYQVSQHSCVATCSHCGQPNEAPLHGLTPYCPNCGAKIALLRCGHDGVL